MKSEKRNMRRLWTPAVWMTFAITGVCTLLALVMVFRMNSDNGRVSGRSQTTASEQSGDAVKPDVSSALNASTHAGGTETSVQLPCGTALPPVTEAQRKAAIELVSMVYSIGPDMVVEVESDVEVEGASCFSVYIGSPNAETTTTMEIYAVNLETNVIYLLDRVTGKYEQVAAAPGKEAIDKALEAILSSPKVSSNPGDYLNAHPEEVKFIVDAGDEVLPYLMSIRDNGDRGLRGVIALELCLMIHPGLNIVSVESPDGRFRLETFGVNVDITAAGLYPANGIRLVDRATARIPWSMSPGYYRTGFQWSPNSRYAAVYYEARIYGETIILDTETMEVIELPDIVELQKLTKSDITERDFRPDPYFEAIRWIDDRWVEIGFRWTGQTMEEISGQFLFDVQDKSVKELELTE